MWNCPEDQVTFVFIRHGSTVWNGEGRYQGITDMGLSAEGRKALLAAKEAGVYPAFDFLFCSPMKRCLETASLLCPGMSPVLIPQWTEIAFGDFEGKCYSQLQGDERYQAWIDSGGTKAFPGGESREEYKKRCREGLLSARDFLKEKMIRGGGGPMRIRAGAIVHGGTIMALLSSLYGGEYFDYRVPNAGGYECELRLWETEPAAVLCRPIGGGI